MRELQLLVKNSLLLFLKNTKVKPDQFNNMAMDFIFCKNFVKRIPVHEK